MDIRDKGKLAYVLGFFFLICTLILEISRITGLLVLFGWIIITICFAFSAVIMLIWPDDMQSKKRKSKTQSVRMRRRY